MKKIVIVLFFVMLFLLIFVLVESDDMFGEIIVIDKDKGLIMFSDGKIYMMLFEFNFDGLKLGVKVVIYYLMNDGKCVIDDL